MKLGGFRRQTTGVNLHDRTIETCATGQKRVGGRVIWCSDWFSNKTHIFPLLGSSVGSSAAYARALRRFRSGNLVERSRLPSGFSAKRLSRVAQLELNAVDCLSAQGLPIVSERSKELLSQFNLGHTEFYEVEIHLAAGVGAIEQRWYIVNLAGPCRCFTGVLGNPGSIVKRSSGLWMANRTLDHDHCSVLLDDVGHRDLWIDPAVLRLPFFSDRLKRAIQTSGLNWPPSFFRCKTVVGQAY